MVRCSTYITPVDLELTMKEKWNISTDISTKWVSDRVCMIVCLCVFGKYYAIDVLSFGAWCAKERNKKRI